MTPADVLLVWLASGTAGLILFRCAYQELAPGWLLALTVLLGPIALGAGLMVVLFEGTRNDPR